MNEVAHLFAGTAGEHAVASQFLIRNWTVAFPALDLGVDLLIADRSYGQVRRVQVKTANAQEQKHSYVALFNLPFSQLATPLTPELLYVFAIFRAGRWSDFLIAERQDLYREHALHGGVGDTVRDAISLRLTFDGSTVLCRQRDFSRYRDNWPASTASQPQS